MDLSPKNLYTITKNNAVIVTKQKVIGNLWKQF